MVKRGVHPSAERFEGDSDSMPLLPSKRSDAYDVSVQPWRHPEMKKKEAVFLLSATRKDGAFVITDDGDNHALHLFFSGKVWRSRAGVASHRCASTQVHSYSIKAGSGDYSLSLFQGKRFGSLDELVTYFSRGGFCGFIAARACTHNMCRFARLPELPAEVCGRIWRAQRQEAHRRRVTGDLFFCDVSLELLS